MKPGYVPMGKQVRAVEIALYVMIVVDLVSVVSTMSEMSLLSRITARGAFSVEEIQANDSRQGAIAALGLIVTLVLGVLFIRWTRQGYRNADIVAPGVRRFGHGWAIGAWFTPFLAAWRPKQIVNDIYAAGHDRRSGSKDQLLTWWWATLLISGTITYTVARSRPDTLTGLRTADRWLTFANVLEIVAAALAVLVVRKVSEALDAAGRQGMTPAVSAPVSAWLPPDTVQPATFWQPDVADAGPPAGPSGPEAVQPKPVWLSDAAPAAPFAEPEPAAPEYSEPPATGSVPPPGWAQSG